MKPQKVAIYILLWLSIAAYVFYAFFSAQARRETLRVERVEIILRDSSSQGNLITTQMVRNWINESKVSIKGVQVDSLHLSELEYQIAKNGFVQSVKCYTSYSGSLFVEVEERCPVLRFLVDGFNDYLTADGEVFKAPYSSAHYVPVITGGYRPYFDPTFSGNILEELKRQVALIDERIAKIEREELYPLYQKRKDNIELRKEKGYRYTRRKWGQSAEELEQEVRELKRENAAYRRQYTAIIHDIDAAISRIEEKQNKCRREQKNLHKKYEDIINLITFVERIERDNFWRSEIVQIVAEKSASGGLRINLIPRSGDYKVILGELTEVDEKLSKLMNFYQTILCGGGWEQFESINVEYRNQIVCK